MRALMSVVLLWAADVLAMLLLARCLLQYGRLHFLHPLAQFCSRSTDWLVKPLRKILPPLGRWDTACLLGAWLVYLAAYGLIALSALPDVPFSPRLLAAHLLFSVLAWSKAAAYVLLGGLVWRMVLSLANPYSPLMAVLQQIYLPLCRPFAFLRIGRWDFSASVLVLVLWWWVVWWLPQMMMRLSLLLLQ